MGVIPAVCTSLGPDALLSEEAELASGRAPMAATLARVRATRAPVPASEVAALRGTCPPAEEREVDRDVAQRLILQPTSYATAIGR